MMPYPTSEDHLMYGAGPQGLERRPVRLEQHLYMIREETTSKLFDPPYEKTGRLGFRPDLTQTELYSHRRRLKA